VIFIDVKRLEYNLLAPSISKSGTMKLFVHDNILSLNNIFKIHNNRENTEQFIDGEHRNKIKI